MEKLSLASDNVEVAGMINILIYHLYSLHMSRVMCKEEFIYKVDFKTSIEAAAFVSISARLLADVAI